MDEREAHGHVNAWLRPFPLGTLIAPTVERRVSARRIVRSAEDRYLVVGYPALDEAVADVILGDQGFRKNDKLARTLAPTRLVRHEIERRKQRSELAVVADEAFCPANEATDAPELALDS